MASKPNWDKEACPVSFHGDTVPCVSVGKAGTTSYNIYSFAGILGSGSTLQQTQYVFGNFVDSETESDELLCCMISIIPCGTDCCGHCGLPS